MQASNAGVVSYDQQGAVTDEIEFFGSPTQIIVDLFGVFAAPTATALNCQWVESSVATTANTYTTLTNACAAGYELTGGGCYVTSLTSSSVTWYVNSRANAAPETTWFCGVTTNTANALWSSARCCQIPGR